MINRCDGFYSLKAKHNFITRYTNAARSTILAEFEGAYPDLGEKLETNIANCFTTSDNDGTTVYTPINSQGKIAQSILNKNPQKFLIQLYCPLQHISSLIPSNVDLGIKILFTDPAKFFVTETAAKKPKYVIKVYQK